MPPTPATTWEPAPDHEVSSRLLAHLIATGAMAEAEHVFTELDAGVEYETLSADEALARLAALIPES